MLKVSRKNARKGGTLKNRYFHVREYKDKMSIILFRRIIRLLADGEFDIVVTTKTRKEAGFIDYESNTIYLNPRLFPVEETLIHEALHILKPELDEQNIIEISSLMFESLNDNRREKLIAYIKALSTRYVGVRSSDLIPTY